MWELQSQDQQLFSLAKALCKWLQEAVGDKAATWGWLEQLEGTALQQLQHQQHGPTAGESMAVAPELGWGS